MSDPRDQSTDVPTVLHRHHLLDLLDNHGHDSSPLGVDPDALTSLCQDL